MRLPTSKSFARCVAIALSAAALQGCVTARPAAPPAPKTGQAKGPKAPQEAKAAEAPSPSYPQKRPLDQARPVRIKSDRLRYYDKRKETEFIGHVVATQDSSVLHADRMMSNDQGQSAWASGHLQLLDLVRKVELLADWGDYTAALSEANLCGGVVMHSVDPYAVSVTVTGQTCWYQSLSQRARLEGGVALWRGQLTATAESAVMDEGGKVIELKGRVVAQLGVNRVQAETAILDGSTKDLIFDGGVSALVIPSQVQDRASHPERP